MKLELGRFREDSRSRRGSSFRAKLLLVLFVPFLALVVVAAAGLSDRFTALHAQEQYGDLSGPLAIARPGQPRPAERERRVVVVRRQRRARRRTSSTRPRTRTDAAVDGVPPERAGVRERRPEPRRARRARRRQPRPRPDPGRAREDRRQWRHRRRRPATSSSASTRDVLDFGERVARDLASPEVAASLTRVVLPRARAARARPRGERATSRCSRAARRRTSATGSVRRRRRSSTSPRSATRATPEELAAFAAVEGTPQPT